VLDRLVASRAKTGIVGGTSPFFQEYTLIMVFDAYIGCLSDKLSAPEWKSGAWMGYNTVSALAM